MRHGLAFRLLALLSVVFHFCFPARLSPAEQDQTQFTTSTNLIQVTAVVRDPKGHPLEGLRAEDFVVEDEGKPQNIRLFEFVRSSAASRVRGGHPGIPIPVHEDAVVGRGDCARTLVLIEPVAGAARVFALRAIKKYLKEKASVRDCVAIVDGAGLTIPFSNDHRSTLAKLDQISHTLSGRKVATPWFLIAVQYLKLLSPLPGRKSMVVFTGSLMTAGGAFLMDLALEANVALYPVDTQSLAMGPFHQETWFAGTPVPLSIFIDQANTLTSSRRYLSAVAEATGGRSLADINDVSRVFDLLQDDSKAYYLLGYYLQTFLPTAGSTGLKCGCAGRA